MIYVIVGGSSTARAKKRKTLLKNLRAEELRWQDMNVREVGTLASTPTLMGEKRAFVLTGALTDTERGEEFVALAKDAGEAAHVLVFEEEKLLKAPLGALQKSGAILEVLEAPAKKETFNVFALASALAARDRKALWLLLMKALLGGTAPENIAGILHWKVRDLLASGKTGTYSKAELVELSRRLMCIYHDSHRGAGDLSLLLERFALTL